MHKSLVVLGVALVAAACRDVPPTSPAAERAVIATQRQHLVPPVTDNGDGTATLTFQPGPGPNNLSDQGTINAGADNFIYLYGTTPAGTGPASPWLMHFNSVCNSRYAYSFYRFDVSELPDAAIVTSARLELYNFLFRFWGLPWPTPTTTFGLYNVLAPWNEGTLSWANQPALGDQVTTVTLPTVTRRDFDDTSADAGAFFEGFALMDITPLYAAWKNGTTPNYGVAYKRETQFCENATATWTYTASSDMPDADPVGFLPASSAWRPKLVVTFVTNQTPTVAIIPPVSALVGAAVTLAANAADADGDALTYAWTVDGVAAGAAESITYTFATAGTHTVSVTVSDGKVRGTATATASVTVLTAVEWIDAMRNTLDVAGLEKGLTNSLGKKLDNAAKSLAKGNTNAALGQLGAFQNELEAALKTGRVPASLGTQLLQMLTQLLAAL